MYLYCVLSSEFEDVDPITVFLSPWTSAPSCAQCSRLYKQNHTQLSSGL